MNPPSLPAGYRFLDRLGRGGTAEVVRAFSESRRRAVALKLPLPPDESDDDTPFSILVHREYELIGRLRFPGLVKIFEVCTDEPAYLAMEICHGPTLDTIGRVDNLDLALNLLSSLALNLEYLRASGLVHGDFKPHNVFLPADWIAADSDRLFWTKLSDFSLGRLETEPEEKRIGMGTVGYMAPETITDGTADHRSDLFALGVTAYRVLTGRHPFLDGETDPAVINSRCREDDVPPVRERRPEVSPEISELVGRLMAKDADQRPASAWDVCVALRRSGATYPYERALQPKHLLSSANNNQDCSTQATCPEDRDRRRLAMISGKDGAGLRLTLTANWRRRNLTYRDGTFEFEQRPYWPCRMRYKALREFTKAPTALRRALIKSAVSGVHLVDEPGGHPGERAPSEHANTIELVRALLRPATVRRLSFAPAMEAEKREEYDVASRLFVQAGDLERAERCAYQATILLQKEHRFKEALAVIRPVVDYADLVSRSETIMSLLKTKGDILRLTGQTRAAKQTFFRVEELCRLYPNDTLLARTYKSLGDLHKNEQQFAQGIEVLNRALEIYQANGNELELSHTYNNIGNMHFIAGERAEAGRHYRKALRIQRHLNARTEVASTLSNIGGVLATQGRLKRATKVLTLSLKLKRELGDIGEIARSLNNLGYIYHLLGKKEEAIEAATESLELNRRIDSKKEMLFNLDNLIISTLSSGQLNRSLEFVQEGLALARAIDDKPHQMIFHRNNATLLRRLGRFGEAEEEQSVAEGFGPDVDDREEEARLITNRAAIRLAIGDCDEAITLLRRALDLADEVGIPTEKLNALLYLTRLIDAPADVDKAMHIARDLELAREQLLLQCNLLEQHLAAGRLEDAGGFVHRLEPEITALAMDIERPRLLMMLSRYYLDVGKTIKAREYNDRAATLASRSGMIPETIEGLVQVSRLYNLEGRFEDAFAASRQALALCKQVAENIRATQDRSRYQETPTVQGLVAEIRKLQRRLGQKKGTGEKTPVP